MKNLMLPIIIKTLRRFFNPFIPKPKKVLISLDISISYGQFLMNTLKPKYFFLYLPKQDIVVHFYISKRICVIVYDSAPEKAFIYVKPSTAL